MLSRRSAIPASNSPIPDDNGTSQLTHHQLLGRRWFLNSLVRYAVAGGFTLSGFLALPLLELSLPTVVPLIYLGMLIGSYNTPVFLFLRSPPRRPLSNSAFTKIRRGMYCVVILDFLCLAVAVYLLGGAGSPFLAFYLLHVALSCILLSKRAAISFTIMAFTLIALQVLGEWQQFSFFAATTTTKIIPHEPITGAAALATLVVYAILFALFDGLLISIANRLRQNEKMLRRQNQQLAELSRIRRDFLHLALHNVKSPIGAVMMLLENLTSELAGPINPKQRQWLERCAVRLGGLSELLRDLQILGELETEELADRFEPVDLRHLLRAVKDEYASNAESCGHTLTVDLPETLPPVPGIERLLREAVINYLTNAIKYTPPHGQLVLRARLHGEFVRLEVIDNGIGLSDEDQRQLFAEFRRVQKAESIKKGIPGTGLGLSIVKRIADQHAGNVGVESAIGKGSTFFLELPALKTNPSTQVRPASAES